MLKQVIDVMEVLDRPDASGDRVAALLKGRGASDVRVREVRGTRGGTSFVTLLVPGTRGRSSGGTAPTLGIIGYLGGVGARPHVIGLVSDADGAVTALSAGLKLVDMQAAGDRLPGDVIVTTHVSPASPIVPHEPVPFMNSPIAHPVMTRYAVDARMDAILSIDTTRGNRVINARGFAISPTVKSGYILRVSEDLLTLQQHVTGRLPSVFALTMQDITPYGNGVFHLNSILQPSTVTDAPVVGVAITSEVAVPGCASGATHETDIGECARFAVEVAKGFGARVARFHDEKEFARLVRLYGPMSHLQARRPRAARMHGTSVGRRRLRG